MENQLKIANDKKIIFELQAKKCYDCIIKTEKEYEKIGMIKIIDEMIAFGYSIEELRLPSICGEKSLIFIKQYCKWKWEVREVEVEGKTNKKKGGHRASQEYNNEEMKKAHHYLAENVRENLIEKVQVQIGDFSKFSEGEINQRQSDVQCEDVSDSSGLFEDDEI